MPLTITDLLREKLNSLGYNIAANIAGVEGTLKGAYWKEVLGEILQWNLILCFGTVAPPSTLYERIFKKLAYVDGIKLENMIRIVTLASDPSAFSKMIELTKEEGDQWPLVFYRS